MDQLKSKKDAEIRTAAIILKTGGMVAFPTDTVYGLGVDPFNEEAVSRIYKAKNRDEKNGLPILVNEPEQVLILAESIPPTALKLMKKFWPGALTIVLLKNSKVPNIVSGGQNTIAVRMPDNEVALNLIKEFGGPIVGTSANRSGFPEAVSPEDAYEKLGIFLDYAIGNEEISLRPSSTILDLTSPLPRILREGTITEEEIIEFLDITVDDILNEERDLLGK